MAERKESDRVVAESRAMSKAHGNSTSEGKYDYKYREVDRVAEEGCDDYSSNMHTDDTGADKKNTRSLCKSGKPPTVIIVLSDDSDDSGVEECGATVLTQQNSFLQADDNVSSDDSGDDYCMESISSTFSTFTSNSTFLSHKSSNNGLTDKQCPSKPNNHVYMFDLSQDDAACTYSDGDDDDDAADELNITQTSSRRAVITTTERNNMNCSNNSTNTSFTGYTTAPTSVGERKKDKNTTKIYQNKGSVESVPKGQKGERLSPGSLALLPLKERLRLLRAGAITSMGPRGSCSVGSSSKDLPESHVVILDESDEEKDDKEDKGDMETEEERSVIAADWVDECQIGCTLNDCHTNCIDSSSFSHRSAVSLLSRETRETCLSQESSIRPSPSRSPPLHRSRYMSQGQSQSQSQSLSQKRTLCEQGRERERGGSIAKSKTASISTLQIMMEQQKKQLQQKKQEKEAAAAARGDGALNRVQVPGQGSIRQRDWEVVLLIDKREVNVENFYD